MTFNHFWHRFDDIKIRSIFIFEEKLNFSYRSISSDIFNLSTSESESSSDDVIMALDLTLRRCLALRCASGSTSFFFLLCAGRFALYHILTE